MEELYIQFKQKVKNIQVTTQTLISLIRYAMEIVEFSELKGAEQKKVVLEMVAKLIKEYPTDASSRQTMLDFLKLPFVSQTIDTIVDASKGKLQINKDIVTVTKCCGLFL